MRATSCLQPRAARTAASSSLVRPSSTTVLEALRSFSYFGMDMVSVVVQVKSRTANMKVEEVWKREMRSGNPYGKLDIL